MVSFWLLRHAILCNLCLVKTEITAQQKNLHSLNSIQHVFFIWLDFYIRSYHHIRGKYSQSQIDSVSDPPLTPSDRLHPLCRSLLLLLCPLVTRCSLRRESPANAQTCLATKDPCPPCWPTSGYLQCKTLNCPCCPTASCPVTLASGTLRTSTRSSPHCQVGAASSVSETLSLGWFERSVWPTLLSLILWIILYLWFWWICWVIFFPSILKIKTNEK